MAQILQLICSHSMSYLLHLFARLLCLIFVRPFIRVAQLPQPLPEFDGDNSVFVLSKPFAADELALKTTLKQQGIENPTILALPHQTAKGFTHKKHQKFIEQLVAVSESDSNKNIIPVSVFWGRSPRKAKSLWQVYLTNSWAVPSRLKRSMIVLFQSRQCNCFFGQPTDIQHLKPQAQNADFTQQACQLLSQTYIKQKEVLIGPDQSHQRTLKKKVLNSPTVIETIANLEAAGEGKEKQLYKKADKYLKELASDYSYPVVRVFDIFLTWLWEKLYQGVEVRGMENVLEVAEDHELIYVPCHRSHIDYLLLSYVVYHKGLMPPHIAAGINLNLPVVGSLLRRAGAFFIRRQFRDNKLYRAVLESYVSTMCKQGYPIEYFIEGGRSRTGFLLPPKPGMLAMTMRAAQNQTEKPLAFLPVYIGYERLLESHSYINELYGEKKQKESLLSLLSARHYLKEDYGKVYMSVGKAIKSDDIWHEVGVETSPKPAEGPDFMRCIDTLGRNILTHVNGAAYVSSQNFIATALLSSKRNALVEKQLHFQIKLLSSMTQAPIYRDSLKIDELDAEQAIEHALALNLVQKNEDSLGDIYFLNQQSQVSATFLRNNTLHIFILPALIASMLINVEHVSGKRIMTLCLRLYPYLKSELFLPWKEDELEPVIQHVLDQFEAFNLVKVENGIYQSYNSESEAFHSLLVLSGAIKGSIERFYMTAEILVCQPQGHYDTTTLETACTKLAERLSLLHEFHAPDFFDKNLFRTFIQSLIKEEVLKEDEDGKLHYHRLFTTAKKQARYVLSPSVKRSIKHITQNQSMH